ncbi:MAG: undecaprenyl diphosphate synthase family protein [Pseudoalteromonas sp.]|uniref:DUF6279 family lipoprotein n=1 Tax=Pseudoalteromonas sp. TaxID=53249 RepID=UPI001DC14D39|nr:DUF6279 family lipoprotein [Pseudoalteromonas sp.]NRA77695.1 undecaprenyl diphosphate synthase family protein [Pseudoalteromonas sp.]
MKKLSKYLIVFSLLFTVAGCSPSFTYNNLGWLSGFWIDDYVDLNSDQTDKFKHIVKTSRDWHRETQLPLYKRDLESLKAMLDKQVDHNELKAHFVQAKQHWQTLVDKIEPELIDLANALSYEQRVEFVAALQENINDEYQEHEEKTLKQHQKERLEENLENYKEWFGTKLSAQQKTLIENSSNTRVSTFLLWMQYKQKRLDTLKTLFMQKQKPADFNQQLAVIINDRFAFMSEELIAADDKNLDNYVNLLLELKPTLTDKQRRNVRDEFDELIEEVSDLIEG